MVLFLSLTCPLWKRCVITGSFAWWDSGQSGSSNFSVNPFQKLHYRVPPGKRRKKVPLLRRGGGTPGWSLKARMFLNNEHSGIKERPPPPAGTPPTEENSGSGGEHKQKKDGQMKKIIMIIALTIAIPTTLVAATMCSKNDTITIMLDPSIGDSSNSTYGYSTAQSTWWTAFPYGTVRGISACLSSKYGQSLGGAVADLHDNNALVVGGETNGEHCWCKMTHPAASLWVFNYTSGSASGCADGCAAGCGYNVQYGSVMRSGLFGSVRQ